MALKPDPYAFKDPSLMGETIPPQPRTYARHALLDEAGNVVPIGPDPVPLDVWAERLDEDTGKPTGYINRVRMRTLGEVFADLHQALDVVICDKCGHEQPSERGRYCLPHEGCGGEMTALIDEYLSGPDGVGREEGGRPVPHDFRWVACFPVTGTSEAHYVHVDFVCPAEGRVEDGEPNTRLVRLALAKTFRGMEHAALLARRFADLLGA